MNRPVKVILLMFTVGLALYWFRALPIALMMNLAGVEEFPDTTVVWLTVVFGWFIIAGFVVTGTVIAVFVYMAFDALLDTFEGFRR